MRWVYGPIFVFMLIGAVLALISAAVGPLFSSAWQFAGMVAIAVVLGMVLLYLHTRIVRRRH
ncbi:MAG: hypothetical protein ACK47B_26940 [Armatimonadota bacterium]